jgi:hypothetical protein
MDSGARARVWPSHPHASLGPTSGRLLGDGPPVPARLFHNLVQSCTTPVNSGEAVRTRASPETPVTCTHSSYSCTPSCLCTSAICTSVSIQLFKTHANWRFSLLEKATTQPRICPGLDCPPLTNLDIIRHHHKTLPSCSQLPQPRGNQTGCLAAQLSRISLAALALRPRSHHVAIDWRPSCLPFRHPHHTWSSAPVSSPRGPTALHPALHIALH